MSEKLVKLASVSLYCLTLIPPAVSLAETVKPFSVPRDGWDTEPHDINSSGTIVGSYYWGDDYYGRYEAIGFVRNRGGKITEFKAENSFWTYPTAINSIGTIVGRGWFYGEGPGTRAFIRDTRGDITLFDAPGADLGTIATDITDAGVIIGALAWCEDPERSRGFIRTPDGKFTVFTADPSPYHGTFPKAINSAGEITGVFWDGIAETNRGFVRTPAGKITIFNGPSPNAQWTQPNGIDSAGQITGTYIDTATNNELAFVRSRSGAFTVFESGTLVSGISPSGMITGTTFRGSEPRMFVRSVNGQIHRFREPWPGYDGRPTAVNNVGEVTGVFTRDVSDFQKYKGFVRIP